MRFTTVLALPLALVLASCGSKGEEPPDRTDPGAEVFPDQPEPAPAGRFAPRNDCIELPNAKMFFLNLSKAVRDRDVDALLSLTDPKVKLDFGDGGGLNTFRERLGAEDSELWEELDTLLNLGCATGSNGDIILPWYFAQDLGVDDPFSTMITMGPDIVLRADPSAEGPPVEKIAWDTVTLLDEFKPGAKFLKVRSRSGKEGYIAAADLRPVTDYRLTASPKGDEWRITSLVAGD